MREAVDEEVDITAFEVDKEFTTALSQLQKRCETAGLPFKCRNTDLGPVATIELPAGRAKRSFDVGSIDRATDLLAVEFERQVLLGDYVARCCYEEDVIEAAIVTMYPPMTLQVLQRLYGDQVNVRGRARNADDDDTLPTISASANDDGTGPTITIGPISPTLQALDRRPVLRSRRLSLTIRGARIKHHDTTLRLLTSVSSAVFFDLDLRLGIVLQVARDPDRPVRRGQSRRAERTQGICFPRYQYDHESISLYWYARSAVGMPLLRYLAFYQAIEFYFPLYSRADAARRVRNLLKNPGFNVNREHDIGRLLAIVQAGANKSFGDERSQLKATLRECLDAEGLQQFISDDADRLESLSSKNSELSRVRLNLDGNDDIREQVAERIYDIRCKIVHSKAISAEPEVKLLLPFSREAESMGHDVALIEYVAQQVLVASSSPLTV